MGRLRAWIKLVSINLGLTVVLFVVALLCVEVYLRVTIPSSSGESIFESTLTTPRYKVMKKNFRIIAYGSEVRTNNLGFRDRAAEVAPKRPSAIRLIVLGDSFTVSAGVDVEKIYTSLLERELGGTASDVEVLNLAVGGYNIVQYAMVLDEVGWSLEPDLVVVAVFPFNDLSNDTYRANHDQALGKSSARATPWHENTYVYRAYLGRVENRVRSWLPSRPSSPHASAQSAKDDRPERDAEENLASLQKIVDDAKAHDVGVVVALLPNTDEPEGQREYFAPFETLCKSHDWNCLNLLDRFIASGERPGSLRLNVLDPHPNERYNALAARFLSDYLAPFVDAQRARRPLARVSP